MGRAATAEGARGVIKAGVRTPGTLLLRVRIRGRRLPSGMLLGGAYRTGYFVGVVAENIFATVKCSVISPSPPHRPYHGEVGMPKGDGEGTWRLGGATVWVGVHSAG